MRFYPLDNLAAGANPTRQNIFTPERREIEETPQHHQSSHYARTQATLNLSGIHGT
jgi:hypothetical protein